MFVNLARDVKLSASALLFFILGIFPFGSIFGEPSWRLKIGGFGAISSTTICNLQVIVGLEWP